MTRRDADSSQDAERGDSLDMREYHDRERATYVPVFLALVLMSLTVNLLASAGLGVANWGAQNALVLAMVPAPILALIVKRNWVQVMAPLIALGGSVAFAVIYYPALAE